MKTPVIIAACNEADYIGRTLSHLDAACIEPIVAINGSTDNSRQIAEDFGVAVVEREEQGKLPIIQTALQMLGERALEPVLYTDADSYPLFSKRWANDLTAKLKVQERPACVAGPILYCDGRKLDNTARSAVRVMDAWKRRNSTAYHSVFGSNMGTKLMTQDTLDAVLAMPHIWPGEDRAIVHEVLQQEGSLTYTINPLAVVMTSARYHLPLFERLTRYRGDRTAVHEQMLQSYYDRSASNVEARFIDGVYEPVE